MTRRKPPSCRVRPFLARVVLAAVLMTGDASAACLYHAIGSGTDACGSWTANAREYVPGHPVTHGSIAHKEHAQWVVGFLSGVGYTGGDKDLDPLNNVDAAGVWAWVDDYCRAHPIQTLITAATAFIKEHPR